MAGVKGQRSGGHNRKSTQRHRAAGTYREDRHGGAETPDPPTGHPRPPLPLNAIEKAEWHRMVDRLDQAKTLTKIDDGILYQYVQLFAETHSIRSNNTEIRKLSRALKKEAQRLEGAELVDAIGKIVQLQLEINRDIQKLRMGHLALRVMLSDFGLTPAARNRVKVVKPAELPKAGKLMAFMGGKADSA